MRKTTSYSSEISTSLVVYDIINDKFTSSEMQIRKQNMYHINKTKDGFYNFVLCQTSSLKKDEKS